MLVRWLHTFALAWCLVVLCLPSCGGDPPADADPCRLERCDAEDGRETVCSPIDGTVATTLDQAARFLYEGPDPLQAGLDASALDPRRVAVLRGKVTHDGAPVTGATVTVAGHPEYGKTLSRCDGAFDLAVNGGAPLTVSIEGPGYLPVRRRVEPRWQSYAVLPEVVLTTADAPVEVDLAAGGAVQASLVSDKDGERRATLLFQPGTVASVNGQPLPSSINVRATEYTVGADGPKKMPATLPSRSGYTYAVEYSIDEAAEGGGVTFDRPVPAYVENFLDMPVGTRVPAGHYDRQLDAWIPSDDGTVIKILGVHGALADVDSDGDGVADDVLGMSESEREQLALLYQAGQSLWRVPVFHFSSWDFNWPFGLPSDAIAALKALEDLLHTDDAEGACKTSGSIIDCDNQSLGEAFPIGGTQLALHYSSDRVPGRKAAYSLKLHVLPVPKPASLKRIDVALSVAGQLIEQHFDCTAEPGCNAATTATFTWDGKDAYGRTVQGRQPAEVRIGYAYDGVYEAAAPGGFGKEGSGVAITGSLTRQEVSLESVWHGYLGTFRVAPEGLGGLSIDVHHRYDPLSQTVYFGDGEKETSPSQAQVISLVAGGCLTGCNDKLGVGVDLLLPQGVAAAGDGSVLVAETNQHRIVRVTSDGYIATVAGMGTLSAPQGLALGADGALYIADTGNHRIRRLKDGQLSTVAGDGDELASGTPVAVAVAPDSSLYVVDSSQQRLWRVEPGGKIVPFAGTGAYGASGDEGKAIDAALGDPAGVAVGKDGSVYVSQSSSHRVRRIRPDGVIEPFAGTGSGGFSGDGSAATTAALQFPRGLAVGGDGSVYIADSYSNRIRRVGPDGLIQTVAGVGLAGVDGDGGPATAAELNEPRGLAVAPDGSLYVGDVSRVRRLAPVAALPGYTGVGDIVIPSSDGSQLFIFTAEGRHRETRDAYTGALIFSFGYTDGLLTSITDSANNQTRILRNAAKGMVEIVSPFGRHTLLSLHASVEAEGYLRELQAPGGETVALSYGPGGLLTGLTDPRKHDYTFHYDSAGLGRLTLDQDPAGGSKRLLHTEQGKISSVDVITAVSASPAVSVTTTYRTETQSDGGERRTVTRPDRVDVETVSTPEGTSTTSYVDGTTVQGGGHTITDERTPTPFGEPDLYIAKRDGVEIFRIDYDPFDVHGQLRQKTETIKGGTPHVFEYAYDKARQLSSYAKDGGPATIFTYDLNGNRTGPGWGATDDQDRLPSSPAASTYTYQANGELSTKTTGGQTTAYAYDLLGNLRSVQRPAPAALISYGVDGLNRRISKSVGGSIQRAWAYDGARIVAEINGATYLTARFVYGTRPQVPDYMIHVPSGEVYRILTDHLGSVRLVVRLSDGAIVQELAYDPWGAVEKDTHPGFQPFGFAGGMYDPDTHLVRFGARDYDPATGRWSAKDPSGFAGGTNLYAYANNDPVNLIDLTGENPVFFLLAGAMEGIAGDLFFQKRGRGAQNPAPGACFRWVPRLFASNPRHSTASSGRGRALHLGNRMVTRAFAQAALRAAATAASIFTRWSA